MSIPFDNSYARLPERFYARVNPTPVAAPRIVRANHALAQELGLDPAQMDAALLCGNRLAEGSEPIAQAYSGHQFGHFSPSLGDGRAILLGELISPEGQRHDIQLKGSGPTPFSRRGDGRAALGPVLREYLLGEAMHAMGIPTTRALAAVATGEPVYRESALPGAILTRVASSHIRVGTFQYFAARRDTDAVRTLADYTIARHFPALAGDYAGLLHAVIDRQARLIAQWMLAGFIHGVMNTDNMAVCGQTIDYGPCAFMESYDPATVFSSIDEYGRYAYGQQPKVAAWNLSRFAETLLPLLHEHEAAAIELAKEALDGFGLKFEQAYLGGLQRKIGLGGDQLADVALVQELLEYMHSTVADWTLTFRGLAAAAEGDPAALATLDPGWARRWLARLRQQGGTAQDRADALRAVNPLYIPRNHLVEAALLAATQNADFAPFEALLSVITQPFAQRRGHERFALAATPSQCVLATYCGT